MKQLKKTLLTLVALLAVTTGAWADEVKNPIVYDFEAAANAGETPINKNGSEANGQQFYGWESETYKDRARNDYKGYEYAEGSKLPEVCHVWRRSDRINGNVSGNGGLKCPSNKEMAVDGLKPGNTVTIIYDATGAADDSKELVWAIGDGSSESLGEPRAKAIINGAEAVPGTTTIKSGDVITVTKVTPAANGSGYIVFAVKKDMVIKKIIIDEAKAASGYTVSLNDGTENPTTWTASTDGTNFGALAAHRRTEGRRLGDGDAEVQRTTEGEERDGYDRRGTGGYAAEYHRRQGLFRTEQRQDILLYAWRYLPTGLGPRREPDGRRPRMGLLGRFRAHHSIFQGGVDQSLGHGYRWRQQLCLRARQQHYHPGYGYRYNWSHIPVRECTVIAPLAHI